uniref:Secreted protein n=1 Tax=Anopheles melas TaxID=34690 RepID=A0A182UFR3_9DIPT
MGKLGRMNHWHALSFVTLRLVLVVVGKRNTRTRTNRRFDRPKSSLIQCAHQYPERLELLVIRRQQHKRTSTTARPGQLAGEPCPLGNGENALQRRMTHTERAQQIVVNADECPQSLVHRVGGFV